MLIACHFRNTLGLNSYFQKILANLNKIVANFNILLLPAITQATTITHGDTELHVNYYELFMYMIQIMVIMIIFSVIIWLCIQIWNCINTRNLGKLQEKIHFMQFLYADKTEFYFQFISNYMTWSIYLGSVYDNPESVTVSGQFINGGVTLLEGVCLTF